MASAIAAKILDDLPLVFYKQDLSLLSPGGLSAFGAWSTGL